MRLIRPSYKILTDLNDNAGIDILRRIERAGRTCYKSEDKMTDDSAIDFGMRIMVNGHESVIEHESLSVKFVCDRGVTHELVRHRLAAYSQESTRYCNYSGGVTFVIPPWVNISEGDYPEDDDNFLGATTDSDRIWVQSMILAEITYQGLLESKWSPQQVRSVLPNSLKTEIVMTANLREWRHVLRLRTSKAAHPQMREIMIPLLMELQKKIPVIFDDLLPMKA